MQRSSLWVAIALLIVSFILGRVRVHPIIRERSFIIIKPAYVFAFPPFMLREALIY